MSLERQLLLASFGVPPPQSAGTLTQPSLALQLLQQNDHVGALAAALCGIWAASASQHAVDKPGSPPDWFDAARSAFDVLLKSGSAEQAAIAAEQLLVIAVAALYLFVQQNLCGPILSLPECPFAFADEASEADWQQKQHPVQQEEQQQANGAQPASSTAGFGRDTVSPGDRQGVVCGGLLFSQLPTFLDALEMLTMPDAS
jgi:hypothetical protein